MATDNMKAILKLLERLPVPVVIANPVTAEILWVNSRLVRMAAAQHPDQVVGKSLFDFIQAPQVSKALADLARVALKQAPPAETYQLRKFSGEYAAAQVSSIPMLYHNTLAMLSIVTDVSERESLMREMSESEERYRLLLENTPAGVTVTVDDTVRYANSAFAHMLGYESSEDVIGRHLREIVAEESRAEARQARKQAIMSGEVRSEKPVNLIRADGSTVAVNFSTNRIRWDGLVGTQTTSVPSDPVPNG